MPLWLVDPVTEEPSLECVGSIEAPGSSLVWFTIADAGSSDFGRPGNAESELGEGVAIVASLGAGQSLGSSNDGGTTVELESEG